MNTSPVWSTATAYALCDPRTLCWWDGRGWVDCLAHARFYHSWDRADKAAERSPFCEGAVTVAVALAVVDDSRRAVLSAKELREKGRQRPLF